jgi:hypothetical protein
MGLGQQRHSLYCGLRAGLCFEVLNGEDVLYISDVPFELERIVGNWIFSLPEDLLEPTSPNSIFREDPIRGRAITRAVCEDFITWLLEVLKNAQEQPDFQEKMMAIKREKESFPTR